MKAYIAPFALIGAERMKDCKPLAISDVPLLVGQGPAQLGYAASNTSALTQALLTFEMVLFKELLLLHLVIENKFNELKLLYSVQKVK